MDEVARLRALGRAMRELGVDECEVSEAGIKVKMGPAPSRILQLEERIASAGEPEEAAVAIEELKEEKAKQAADQEREELETMLASTPFAGNQDVIASLMTPRNGTEQ